MVSGWLYLKNRTECQECRALHLTIVQGTPLHTAVERVTPLPWGAWWCLLFCTAPMFYQVTVSSARVTIWSPTFLKNRLPSADVPYPCTGVFHPLKFVHYRPRRRRHQDALRYLLPIPSRLRGLGECCTLPAGFWEEPRSKMKMILVSFVPLKPPLVNRILLNAAKCCVIELLQWC